MNVFLTLIGNLQHIAKYDKTKIIIYIAMALFIYYFMEKIEFRKIALLILIFVGVFFYFNKETITETMKNKKSDLNNIENKIQKMKITQNGLKQEIDIDKLRDIVEKIGKFIKINTNEIKQKIGNSSKDNKNLDIYENIKSHIAMYIDAVEMVIENAYRKDQSLQKLRAIKSEIFMLIHSLHFKVDIERDDEITSLIKELNKTFNSIDKYLVKHINMNFYKNPNYQCGTVNNEKEPRSFDTMLDRDCHLVEF